MSKKPDMRAAMANAAGKPSATPAPAEPASAPTPVAVGEPAADATGLRPGDPGYRIPSRVGKKIMALHVTPEGHRQVAVYAAQQGIRIEHVLKEAMNLWAESKNLPPIY